MLQEARAMRPAQPDPSSETPPCGEKSRLSLKFIPVLGVIGLFSGAGISAYAGAELLVPPLHVVTPADQDQTVTEVFYTVEEPLTDTTSTDQNDTASVPAAPSWEQNIYPDDPSCLRTISEDLYANPTWIAANHETEPYTGIPFPNAKSHFTPRCQKLIAEAATEELTRNNPSTDVMSFAMTENSAFHLALVEAYKRDDEAYLINDGMFRPTDLFGSEYALNFLRYHGAGRYTASGGINPNYEDEVSPLTYAESQLGGLNAG